MVDIIGICVALGLFIFVCWFFSGDSKRAKQTAQPSEDEIIDSSDPQQIGLLIGMTGGSIPDGAVAQYALRRFEEIHGRKATFREVAMLVGLVNTPK